MKALHRMASFRLCDDAMLAGALQGACYVGAVSILILAVRALVRSGATHAELVIGLLAASTLAVGLVILGTLNALLAELRRR